MFYQIIKTGKDEIGLVWSNNGNKLQVEHVYLPSAKEKMRRRITRDYPAIHKLPRRIPGGIDRWIVNLYNGKRQEFDLSLLNISWLTAFSAKVLKQTCKIPRGKVATYAELAAKVGNPRAARAVGMALANNPFPLIIPCHRVVRADRKPGQFGGGMAMKRQLLEKEGVILDVQGKISPINH